MGDVDEEVLKLHNIYLNKMISAVPSGAIDADELRKSIGGADSICESIAKSSDPFTREIMISSLQSSCLGAAEGAGKRHELMMIFSSYIRERVDLALTKLKMYATDDVTNKSSQTNEKTNEISKPRESASDQDIPLKHEIKAICDLRREYVEKMMGVPRPTSYENQEEIESILFSLDKTCDYICKIDNSEAREIALSAMHGAFKPFLDSGYNIHSFLSYLSTYVRDGVIVRLLNEPTFSSNAPRIVIQSLIIPGDKTKEGILVKGVSTLWFEMMRRIKNNPDIIYHLDCWKWEEMLAGAYKQDGWEIVTLTPKKNDKGIDVIAERTGLGKLRFLLLDQMKAYKPDHLIGPDEIREMKGVLLDHPEASKGLITTTAHFTPGALEAVENLAPRLELRPKDKLVSWLASIIVGDE